MEGYSKPISKTTCYDIHSLTLGHHSLTLAPKYFVHPTLRYFSRSTRTPKDFATLTKIKDELGPETKSGKYYENQGRDRNPEIKIAFLFSGFRSLSVLVFYFPLRLRSASSSLRFLG